MILSSQGLDRIRDLSWMKLTFFNIFQVQYRTITNTALPLCRRLWRTRATFRHLTVTSGLSQDPGKTRVLRGAPTRRLLLFMGRASESVARSDFCRLFCQPEDSSASQSSRPKKKLQLVRKNRRWNTSAEHETLLAISKRKLWCYWLFWSCDVPSMPSSENPKNSQETR